VVTINCPLHEGTRGLFSKELIGKMKPGSYLVRPYSVAVLQKWHVLVGEAPVTVLLSSGPMCQMQTQLGPSPSPDAV
jgi:hypothetical protein